MHYSEHIPSKENVREWINSVLQHSCRVEQYMHVLGIGHKDLERPHDIVGFGNKLESCVIRGLASGYDKKSPIVKESLRIHREQYHHKMWNVSSEGEAEDMLVGALDSICALLENRKYQGGSKGWDGAYAIANRNPRHKKKWMLKLLPIMQKIPEPKVNEITLDSLLLANLTMPVDMKERIEYRVQEARQQLEYEGWL